MTRVIRLLGSITIAVPLLIAIAIVLAWGTIYETRFGTAAVQRFIYHSWWFQTILAFLAMNLALAALERYPWKRQHAPFVLAHVGIILILLGGILGGRFGIEGQLIIPEGQAERVLEQPGNVLVVHQPNPGVHHVIPTNFETQAWVHEPRLTIPVPLEGRTLQLTVDRYYPDAIVEEEFTDDGPQDNPAVHLVLRHNEQEEAMWLLARDPERFGTGWGEAHVLFLEATTKEQAEHLLQHDAGLQHPRGVVRLKLPKEAAWRDLPVPTESNQRVELTGTPYQLLFKDYFPDFVITEQGPVSRSTQPHNPAVSFILSGPEGADPYLLFAQHPEFQAMHGLQHEIPVEVAYVHDEDLVLPPNCIGIVRVPAGTLAAVMTDATTQRQVIESVETGQRYTNPWLGYEVEVAAYYPRARLTQRITNRSNEVHAETVHVVAKEADQSAEAWVGLRQTAELQVGKEPILVEYRPSRRELPFTVKLLDFRKIDYPGTQMASGFESDVELTDSQRGIILMRKISMNNPLRYRGFSFYQSSYIPGPTETTVLSVRNDPGTPFVYAGFIIVIAGVVSMFVMRTTSDDAPHRPKRKAIRRRSSST